VSTEGGSVECDEGLDLEEGLDEEQKRRLRAVRRGYRAQSAEIKNNGWEIEVSFLDGSKVVVNSKHLKLKAAELCKS